MANEITKIQKRIEDLNARFQQPKNVSAVETQTSGTDEETNKGGFWGGVGYTLEKLGLGVMRSVEGLTDYVVGGVGDLFGADDFAENLMKNDWVNYSHADEWYNPSGTMSFVGDVAGGIGNMLPSIGLAFIPSVGAAVSSAQFVGSAMGQATSEAVKQTGDLSGKEWLYGTASGAAEGIIEKISGGIGGTAPGKFLGKQLTKTIGGKVASAFIGEGLEEVASDVLDPKLKQWTGVDKEASMPTLGELARTFAVGGVTGTLMGGGKTLLKAAVNGGFNKANAVQNTQELEGMLAENNVKQAESKKSAYTQEEINKKKENLSKNLQKMNEEKRSSFLQRYQRIAPFFNSDGTVKVFTAKNDNAQNSGNSASQNKNPATVGARWSIQNIDGKDIVVVDTDQDIFEGVDRSEYRDIARDYIRKTFRPQKVNDIGFTARSAGEYTHSDYSQQLYRQGSSLYDTKMKSSTELDNFIKTGEFIGKEKARHPHSYNEGGYDRYAVEFELGGKTFTGEMLVALNKNSKGIFYDIVKIKEKSAPRYPSASKTSLEGGKNASSTSSIRYNTENVNSFEEKSSKKASQKEKGVSENSFGNSSAPASSYTPFLEERSDLPTYGLKEPKTSANSPISTSSIRYNTENVNTFEEKSSKKDSQTVRKLNEDAYSSSLKGRESTFAFKPVALDSKVSDAAKKAMNVLTKLTKGTANIVLTDEAIQTESGEKANGVYKDGIIYLDANATDYDKVKMVGAHEVIHSLEGTKAYNNLAKYVAETISNDPALQEKYSYEKYRAVYDSILQGEWSETTKDYQATTEIFADYLSKEVLSNDELLNRLGKRKDKGIIGTILGKLFEWVRSAIDRFGMSELDLEAKRILRNMERKLGKALDSGNGGVSLETIEERVRMSQTIDKQVNGEYNRVPARYSVKVAKYITVSQYERNYLYGELQKLYDGIEDGIADGLAIEKENTVFIVDSGKDNGEITFGVRKKLSVSDHNKRKLYVKKINEGAVKHGFVDRKLFGKLGFAVGDDSRSNVRRESGENETNTKGKSPNRENGISQENGNRGVQVLSKHKNVGRASLNVDSAGNGGVSLETIEERVRMSQTIDKQVNGEYNRVPARYSVKVAKYITVSQYERNYLYGELQKLYDGIEDGIADGLAIEKENTVFIVDSGKDNGELSFGVRKKRVISNIALRKEYIRRTNNDRVSKGHISNGLSAKLRVGYDNDWRSDSGRVLREELSADKGQSKNQQSGISQGSGNRGVQGLSKHKNVGRASLNVDSADNGGVSLETIEERVREAETAEKENPAEKSTGKLAANTGIRFSIPIEEYPYNMQTVIKDYIEAVDPTIREMVGTYRDNGDLKFKRHTIGTVSGKTAMELKKLVGEDYSNYAYAINTNAIKHIERRHGINGESDNSMHKAEDIARIPYILQNYDTIDFLRDEKGAIQYSKEFRDNEDKPSPLIVYKKKINGTYYLVEAVGENAYKKLWVVTAYINKKGEFTQGSASDQVNRQNTSETLLPSHSLTTIIRENFEKSTESAKKVGKSSSGRASLDVDKYTEKQYNEFGWARANNVLTARENADFKAKYARIKSGQVRANRTKNGEIIVAVNDGKGDSFGVDNTLVYAKGTIANYKITKVVKINSTDETFLTEAREVVYDCEKRGIQVKASGLFKFYNATDYGYAEFMSNRQRGLQDNAQRSGERDGRRTVGKTSRASIDINSPKVQREAAWTTSLSRYVHRLNLTKDVKADLVELYGKEIANRIFSVWENTSSDGGVDIVTAHRELERDGFSTYSQYPAEFLRDMDSTLRNVAPKIYKAAESGEEMARQETSQGRKRDLVKDSNEIELSGRQAQQVAKYTKKKVYGKQDAEVIVNDILDGYMSYEDAIGSLSGKSRKQVVQMLWEGLNKATPGQQMKIALKVADYLIQHTIMENIHSEMAVEMHSDTIKALKPYLHNLNLDNIKEDIKYHFGNNSPYLRWGKRKGEKGIGIDVAAMELNEKGFYIEEINNVDILLRIDEAYRNAVEGIKQTSTRFVNEILGEEEQKGLRQDLARALLCAFEQRGADSELTKTLREYDKKVQGWKEKYYEERERNNRTLYVLHKVQQLKDVERGTFANASEFKSDIFKKSIGLLGRIKYRGNLNKSGTRKILGSLLEWYVPENPILEGEAYNDEIAKMLMQLADNTKPLTAEQYDLLAELEEKSGLKSFDKLKEWYTRENLGNQYSKVVKSWLTSLADPTEFSAAELRSLENVVDYFKNFIEKYNKVYRNGKLVEAAPLAEKYIKQLQKRKRAKISWLRKPFEKYMSAFADPMTVARYYDGYEDGFFTETMDALRKGAIEAVEMEQNLQAPLEEFYQKHKKFLKESYDRTVEYQGEKISIQQAMLLYMTLKRDQAVRGLAYSGFKFRRENETVSVKGFATEENLDMESLRMQAAQEQETIFRQLNDAEREYISIVEKIFNEDCKKAKSETDILRQGYTNVSEGYYVPIRRASIAQNVEKWTYKDELVTVNDFSFNKDTVMGAKNQLFIDSLTDVLTKHIGGISQYSSLAMALDSYNILFNLNISGNPNVAVNVKSESENVWLEGGQYIGELIDDIKGISKSKGSGQKFIRQLRSGYAKYQLGANPKVWVTQLSSFAAATNILDAVSIVRGFGVKVDGENVDKYCSLAKIRNNENSAALAQGVLEKTGKIGDVLMKPIGAVDRWVVKRLFAASQIQAAKGGGPNLGTAENLTKAGELLTTVILETQQNALATERSAAMRSGNEIMKSFTMFSADSMKVLGRVVDGIGETAVLRAQIRAETDSTVKEQLKERLAKANKKTAKAITALVTSALFMASVALGFKWLYNKDDKEEDVVKNLTVDAMGNLLGGLPVIRDVYSFFSDGYEVQNFAYVAFNDLLDSATIVKDLSNSLIEGKEMDRRELTLSVRKLTYASGQVLGIPTRNVYNVAYGLTKRISPETAYKWNDAFYKASYKSDLTKAIENEDEEMQATIVGLMLNENVGGIEDETTRKVMDSLITSGYNVVPKAVPDKLAYKEGEETVEISLTKKQKDEFSELYFGANQAAAHLVKSAQFNKLSQEGQASALKLVYDTYYNFAVDNCLERDSTQKNVLFMSAFDTATLAMIIAQVKSITADTDKKGKTISGSRKAKIVKYIESLRLTAAQKYMILGYLGYKNLKGEAVVRKFINGLNLSKTEKESLFAYCGYES